MYDVGSAVELGRRTNSSAKASGDADRTLLGPPPRTPIRSVSPRGRTSRTCEGRARLQGRFPLVLHIPGGSEGLLGAQ